MPIIDLILSITTYKYKGGCIYRGNSQVGENEFPKTIGCKNGSKTVEFLKFYENIVFEVASGNGKTYMLIVHLKAKIQFCMIHLRDQYNMYTVVKTDLDKSAVRQL